MPPLPGPTIRLRGICVVICALAVCALLPPSAFAFRLVSWNLLNYPSAQGDAREDDMRGVIGVIAPDVVVCQEVGGLAGANGFLGDVLGVLEPGEWTLASFSLSNDSERALYFRTAEFSEIDHGQLPSTPRTIDWWRLRPTGYDSPNADLLIYVVHLKASTGTDNENERNASAQVLRTHLEGLPAGTHFVVAGDFNIYSSSEPAWSTLTSLAPSSNGRLFDPVGRVGDWHTNSSFADVHTQSTRTLQLSDGGSSGGCDDRFDFVLANDDMLDAQGTALLPLTYHAFGQDGLHFNAAINSSPTNAAVGQLVADQLHAASDHLPVVVDLQRPARASVAADLDFGEVLAGTAGVSRTITIENIAPEDSDELDVLALIPAPFSISESQFLLVPGASAAPEVRLNTSTVGVRDETLIVNTDAPDFGLQFFSATATVVRPAVPSLDGALVITGAQLDFGTHPPGEFAEQAVQVFNLDYDSVQAGLGVFDVEVSGPDAARFNPVAFNPALVRDVPLEVAFAFDDAGVTGGTLYKATATVSTQDDVSVTGSSPRAALVLQLEAFVEDSGTAAPVGRYVTRLLPNVPNPFNPATTIRFELAREGRVRLDLYSAQGRHVRTLVDGELGAGRHERIWYGRAEDGRPVASGVYFARLAGGDRTQVRRVTLVR